MAQPSRMVCQGTPSPQSFAGWWVGGSKGGGAKGGVGWLVGWLLPLCPSARPGPPRLQAMGGRGCVTRCMSHEPRASGLARQGGGGGCGGDPPSGGPELLEAPKAPKKFFGLN